MTITMSLPSKSLYDIAASEYANGEKYFIDEIVNSLTNETIIEAVRNGLKSAYSNKE